MIFIDNIIFSLQRAGGISVVWKNLLKGLVRSNENFKVIEYPNASNNIFRKEIKIPYSKLVLNNNFNPVISQFIHPSIKSELPFIFHSSYFRTCSNPNAINVTTVHDFIYEQDSPSLKQVLRIKLNYNAIRKSNAIVCVSENTKKDLLKFLPEIDPQKVHVIYNGVSEDYSPLSDIPYPIYNNSILFVGGRQGYKNFKFVVESLIGTDFYLLICGADLTTQEKRILDETIPGRYKVISYPTNKELNKIYNSVFALVYPSSYEGFGIPVLEAQRAGCPVIAYNSSSIPEIIGDSPLLLNELTPKDLIEKLSVLQDNSQRKLVIEKGFENCKRFSWQKMAEEYLSLYKNLLKTFNKQS